MFTNDAMQSAFNFALKQTTHVETQVNEVVHADIQYPQLIPVDTTAHPFAKSVTYFSADKFGKAGWVDGNSNDIPVAGTEHQKHETQVHMAGVGYRWGYEEINQAQMMGINLQADDAMAARRAFEEFVDGVAISGDVAKGFQGLINNTSVTADAVATGSWATATANEMLVDVNNLLTGQAGSTTYITGTLANTLLLPYAKLNVLATTPLGDNADKTVLEFLRLNNVYTAMTGQPLTIRGVRGLDIAGAGGVARMVAYRNDPSVLKLHMPMAHRFLPMERDGLNFTVAGVFRLGGLDIRKPAEVRYGDGI